MSTAKLSPWTNQHVLFVCARLDDIAIPYRPMRVLAHLRRALGKRKSGAATGIRRMAEVCRMDANTVERALYWLEENGLVKIGRKHGKPHWYELQFDRSDLYVDHRVDELGLSPSQFRILMHMARLADELGMFFLSERKFAKICEMKRETIHRALQALEDLDLYAPYAARKSPMCFLSLNEVFARESKAASRTGNGNVAETLHTKKPNSMPERPNGSGPKSLTPMPDSPNSSGPIGLTKDNPVRQSNKDYPKDNPISGNPASFANSRGRTTLSAFGIASENGRQAHEDGESPDQLIARLTAKFREFPDIDATAIATVYKAECERNGFPWNNKIFEKRVGKAVHESFRSMPAIT
jgi:DNA-binding transcriptional regulator YhcF (GntR family)